MEFIKQFDFLCSQVHFTFNQKGEIGYKTFTGGFLSLISILTSIIFSTYFFLRLIQRKDSSVILSTERHQNINLTYTNEIPFLFRLSDYLANPLNQSSIYEIYLDYWYYIPDKKNINEITPQKNINLTYEICDIDKHFGIYKDYFKKFTDLKSFFCLNKRPSNLTIFGSYGDVDSFSYLHFKFFTCGNHTNNNSCLSSDKIKTILNDAYLDLRYIDFNIESLSKNKAKQITIKSERLPISYSVFKRVWINFKTIKFISDNGYFFSGEKEEIFHQFSNVRIDTDLRDMESGIKPGYFLASTFSLNGEISKFNRKYLKFQDYLATVGGIIKAITFLCQVLNYYNGKNSYYNKIIQDFIIENQIKKNYNKKNKDIDSKNQSKISILNFINNNIKMTQDLTMKQSSSGLQNLKNNSSLGVQNKLKEKDRFKIKFSNSFLPYFMIFKSKHDKSEMDWYIKTINDKLNIIYVLNILENYYQINTQKRNYTNNFEINTSYNNFINGKKNQFND